jgi:hypothetical protein
MVPSVMVCSKVFVGNNCIANSLARGKSAKRVFELETS